MNVMTHRYTVYVAGAVLIGMQIPIAYVNTVVGGDYIDLINRVLFVMFGLFIVLSAYKDANPSGPEFNLADRVDEDLRPAVAFVLSNGGMFARSDADVDYFISVAADHFEVDEDRLHRAIERLNADMEIVARTGKLPDP